MTSQWFDTEGAAKFTMFAASTLEKLRVYGGGPRFSKVGRSVRYHSSDLDQWLRSRVVGSTSEKEAA